MTNVDITADPRSDFGKGAARRLRRSGSVPAVIYGTGIELTHVALTGRGAPKDLIENADLVTEMTLVHHPFREQGVKAQAGIEY